MTQLMIFKFPLEIRTTILVECKKGLLFPVLPNSLICVCAQLPSCIQLFAIPWTVASQSSLPWEFSRPEYWSGQPFPSPGDLPNPGIKPRSPTLQVDSLLSEPPGKPNSLILDLIKKINFLLILYLPALTFEVKYSHLFPQSSSVLCRTKSLLGGGVGQAQVELVRNLYNECFKFSFVIFKTKFVIA